MQSKINQILRGAETIRRNSMNTDTPPTEVTPICPNCKSSSQVWKERDFGYDWMCHRYGCAVIVKHNKDKLTPQNHTNPQQHRQMTTNTPNTCPHCGAKYFTAVEWACGTTPILDGDTHRSPLCKEREARLEADSEVERLRERLNDCLSFVAFHGPVGATPDTAKLLEKRILATLNLTKK